MRSQLSILIFRRELIANTFKNVVIKKENIRSY